MISTLSESASFITVSVGNEIRIRDGHKSGAGDVQRTSEKKSSGISTDSTEDEKVDELFNKEQVQAIVARLQESLKHVEPRIELSLEKDINRVIFRVVDKESGDLIRQIPPEKVVELDRFLSGHSGLLVEENI
jgi:flagellar protein FlaG